MTGYELILKMCTNKFLLLILLSPIYALCDEFKWDSPEAKVVSGTIVSQLDTLTIYVGWIDLNTGRYETSIKVQYDDTEVDLNSEMCDAIPIVEFKESEFLVTYTYFPIGATDEQTYTARYMWDAEKKRLFDANAETVPDSRKMTKIFGLKANTQTPAPTIMTMVISLDRKVL